MPGGSPGGAPSIAIKSGGIMGGFLTVVFLTATTFGFLLLLLLLLLLFFFSAITCLLF